MSDAIAEQTSAPKGDSLPIVLDVIKDVSDRVKIGIERYGEPLKANNGREALVDAYQEAIDLVMYLRQELNEREERNARIALLEHENAALALNLAVAQDDREEYRHRATAANESNHKLISQLNPLQRRVEDLEESSLKPPQLSDRYKQIIHFMIKFASENPNIQDGLFVGKWSGPRGDVPVPTRDEINTMYGELRLGHYEGK